MCRNGGIFRRKQSLSSCCKCIHTLISNVFQIKIQLPLKGLAHHLERGENVVTISGNPFAEFRRECEAALAYALKKTLPEIKVEALAFSKPSNPEFGQLASSLSFELAKKLNQKPTVLTEHLVKAMSKREFSLVEKVSSIGGYVNFHVDYARFSSLTLQSVKQLGSEYGFLKTDKPVSTVVEHTSVNPLHPIHIGQARNPMLGDALARILKARGHTVSCHYYIAV